MRLRPVDPKNLCRKMVLWCGKKILVARETMKMDFRAVLPNRFLELRFSRDPCSPIKGLTTDLALEVSRIAVPNRAPNYPSRVVNIENIFRQAFPLRHLIDWIIGKDLQGLW